MTGLRIRFGVNSIWFVNAACIWRSPRLFLLPLSSLYPSLLSTHPLSPSPPFSPTPPPPHWLHRADYWSVALSDEHLNKCPIPDSYDGRQVSSCHLHFSICGGLIPKKVCPGHTDGTSCQEIVTSDGRRHYYIVGNKTMDVDVQKPIGMTYNSTAHLLKWTTHCKYCIKGCMVEAWSIVDFQIIYVVYNV